MEGITNLGEIQILSQKRVIWRIRNFYDLPQNFNAVIRSPRFSIDDRDWHMEVYPNGRKLYCSLGWFGIRAFNFNCDCVRGFCYFSVLDRQENICIFIKEESHADGSYCCTRLLPTSFFNSWKDILVSEGDLHLLFNIHNGEDNFSEDTIYFNLIADDVQKIFQKNFENVSVEASVQPEEKKALPMETTIGELDIESKQAKWTIDNFSDLLHGYDTVIRSPCFHYKNSDWYMELYPNGLSLYSSLSWFGIGVCNLNSDSTLRFITIKFLDENSAIIVRLKADSQNKGFYYCSKLLPTSLFKSWQDVIAPADNLHIFFCFDDESDTVENVIHMLILKETMQSWYKQKFENADRFTEVPTQTDQEIGELEFLTRVKEAFKQTDGGACTEKSTENEKDKHQVNEPKESFKELMMESTSNDNFCDYFISPA